MSTEVLNWSFTSPQPIGSKKLYLRAYDKFDDLRSLRPAWDALLSQYPHATTFSTWEWLSCWWRCFGGNRQLLMLALFDSSSLVGLAPFAISKESVGSVSLRVLRLMGDGSGDSDNLDFLVRPGLELIFSRAILQFLRQRPRRWDVSLLNTLPSISPIASCLRELLNSSSWTCFHYSSTCSRVPLSDSWESYSETLDSQDRKNLTRYTRRLQARHATHIYRCPDAEQLPRCLDALYRLHQERWRAVGLPGTFAQTQRRQFYTHLSRLLLARGCLDLWVMELDRQIAAVQFGFRYGQTVFQLQEGYDHERASDRVGFVLRGEVLKRLISEGIRTYDFLGGDDAYKARWGARKGQYQNIHFAPSLTLGAILLHSRDTTGRSKEWLRQRIPNAAWNLLHKANLTLQTKRPHLGFIF